MDLSEEDATSDGDLVYKHSLKATVSGPGSPVELPAYDEHGDTASFTSTIEAEADPWTKKYILSFDGGGVRCCSSLIVLKHIMQKVEQFEKEEESEATSSLHSPMMDYMPPTGAEARDFRPCHYFDYIAGSSTGGLIAIMLGRLRIDVDSAFDEYRQLWSKVFEKPSSRQGRTLAGYSSAVRKETLSNIFHALRPAQPSAQERNNEFKSDSFRCRTLVCSMKRSKEKEFFMPFLFRSYDHLKTSQTPFERNPGDIHPFNIADVARAISGAPSYRRSTKLFEARYYDAAVDMNNPSWEVINEVNLLGGEYDTVDLLLSVGGGNGKRNRSAKAFTDLQKGIEDISDEVHEQVRKESEQHGFSYCRLDVQDGLQDVRLNEWKPKATGEITLRRIEVATRNYLDNKDVQKQIRDCAQALVKNRVQRSQTMRWECFATGTRYRCTVDRCDKQYLRFQNRNKLMDHLESYHDKPPHDADNYEELKKLFDAGRTLSD